MAEEEVKFRFDINFQKKIVNLMLTDVDFFLKSHDHIEPHYFGSEILAWIYKVAVTYYGVYGKIITRDVLWEYVKSVDEDKILEYARMIKDVYDIAVDEREFLLEKVQDFIQRNIFTPWYNKIPDSYSEVPMTKTIQEMENQIAKMKSIAFTPPERTFFFDDVAERGVKRLDKLMRPDVRIPTGITPLDELLYGGPCKGELCTAVGDGKAGKSIFLLNVGISCVRLCIGKVLFINLEGRNGQLEDRAEARMLNETYTNIVNGNVPPDVEKQYQMFKGTFVIRHMLNNWKYTVFDIEQELKDLASYKFVPDLIVVDYADLLSPKSNNLNNTYESQQEVYRDLKTLAMKYDCVVWTASQTSRPPPNVNPQIDSAFYWTRRNLADCYAKVRVSDLLITLNRTDEEKRAEMLRIYIDAARDAECGKIINVKTDYSRMKIYNPTTLHSNTGATNGFQGQQRF